MSVPANSKMTVAISYTQYQVKIPFVATVYFQRKFYYNDKTETFSGEYVSIENTMAKVT